MSIDLERTRKLLARFPRQKILVVGDLMLDRYIHGAVSRISPEAPVPVVHVNREKAVPGGASNVANNIRALEGRAGVAGLVGHDAAAAELLGLLRATGVSLNAVRKVPGHRTIVKTRVIAERQQVVRVDWEDRIPFTGKLIAEFLRRLAAEIPKCSGVIIEDYGKGLIQQRVVDVVLRAAKRARVPVGLDPKENEELDVHGVTLATPNRKEAFFAAGREDPGAGAEPLKDEPLLDVGRVLLKKWRPGLLAITLGPHGMLLMEPGRAPRHVPTRAREVFDVSGAGDTVIATCLLAVAAGASFVEAAEIANYAAGVVVGKLGTAVCSQDELLRYMSNP
jgi:D-beta-D-heptose 7-phosphate kinase/D-beta-D-heptose 1-phosphate adenosyltransferase